ncbi:MAG: GNAT family N-acetyltransferase [Pseudomonadales bacterium]
MATLATERLTLRPLIAGDVPALQLFWNDPEVRRYLWENQELSTEAVAEIVVQSETCFRDLGAGFFAMELLSQPGELAGFCGYRRFEDSDQPELLYGILPEFWGQGFATEAARAVLQFGFESCGMSCVIAATDTPNQRSVQVLQRLGMSFRERREYHGLDTVFYGLANEEFSV